MAKRVMTKCILDEISAVDRPAQEGATVRMFKAAGAKDDEADEDPAEEADETQAEEDAEEGEESKKAKVKKPVQGADENGAADSDAATEDEQSGDGYSEDEVEKDGGDQGTDSSEGATISPAAAAPNRNKRPKGKQPVSKEKDAHGHGSDAHGGRGNPAGGHSHLSPDKKKPGDKKGGPPKGMLFGAAPGGGGAMSKREFSAADRKDDAKSGAAMAGGGFPIENEADLKNAMQALGRAKDRAATIAHIKTRAKALGLTSLLSDVYKNDPAGNAGNANEEDNMTAEEILALQKRAERAEKLALLTDAQKGLFAKMAPAEQDKFLAASNEQREQEVQKALRLAQDSNPVVETVDGIEFRKNDDPRLLAMAKQNKLNSDRAAAAEADARTQRMAKRATEELSHLPGTADEKVALLEALEAVPVAKRDALKKILKAADETAAKSFDRVGSSGEGAEGSPTQKLEKMAKELAAKDKISYAKAYNQVLESDEGQDLYAEHLEQNG